MTPDGRGRERREATMIVDCDTCVVRDVACHDCVIGVLLGTPSADGSGAGPEEREPAGPGDPLPVEFGPVERRALEVLADHGLIPRLRLVPPATPEEAAAQERTGRPARRRDAG